MEQNDIKKIIAEHLAAGVSLTEIQNILANEHNVRMKFLELRLMASELENIDWTKLNKKEEKKPEASAKSEQAAMDNEADIPEDEDFSEDEIPGEDVPEEKGGIQGKTTVELAKVMRPGSVANGSVKFGSGVTAEWVLDQYGRLGLDKASGKPTQKDIKEFQVELQKLLK